MVKWDWSLVYVGLLCCGLGGFVLLEDGRFHAIGTRWLESFVSRHVKLGIAGCTQKFTCWDTHDGEIRKWNMRCEENRS